MNRICFKSAVVSVHTEQLTGHKMLWFRSKQCYLLKIMYSVVTPWQPSIEESTTKAPYTVRTSFLHHFHMTLPHITLHFDVIPLFWSVNVMKAKALRLCVSGTRWEETTAFLAHGFILPSGTRSSTSAESSSNPDPLTQSSITCNTGYKRRPWNKGLS